MHEPDDLVREKWDAWPEASKPHGESRGVAEAAMRRFTKQILTHRPAFTRPASRASIEATHSACTEVVPRERSE